MLRSRDGGEGIKSKSETKGKEKGKRKKNIERTRKKRRGRMTWIGKEKKEEKRENR